MKSILNFVQRRRSRALPWRAASRTVLLAWKFARLVPVINRLRVTLPVGGQWMRVRAFSYDDLLTASADYEPIVRRLAPAAGSTAVDAGAFIGRHTLDLAAAVGPRGRVIAIEPHPANFRLLSENVALNDHNQVTCVPAAAGAGDGAALLRCGRETSTAMLVAGEPARRGDTAICVRALDPLLAELGLASIDFLKIDVEGVELDVLRGAQRTLATSRAICVLVEMHGSPVELARCRVAAWLHEQGLRVEQVTEAQRRFYIARGPAIAALPSQEPDRVHRHAVQ